MLYVNSTGELIKLRTLPPDGFVSYGYAVNDSGVVVGGATRAGRIAFHPFSWQAGLMTDLLADDPGCVDRQALAKRSRTTSTHTGTSSGIAGLEVLQSTEHFSTRIGRSLIWARQVAPL